MLWSKHHYGPLVMPLLKLTVQGLTFRVSGLWQGALTAVLRFLFQNYATLLVFKLHGPCRSLSINRNTENDDSMSTVNRVRCLQAWDSGFGSAQGWHWWSPSRIWGIGFFVFGLERWKKGVPRLRFLEVQTAW